MPTRRADPSPKPPWLSLGDASRMLGVSTATLRRWSDAGRIRPLTTPGGHRRFSRTSLERLLPSGRDQRPQLATAGLTPDRLARAYRRDPARIGQGGAWLATLAPQERQAFGELGRRLAWNLVAHLDATEPEGRNHQLVEATAAAAEYGRRGAAMGLALSDVVEGFLAFRRPFLAEVTATAQRRGFDATEVASLFDDAERALDRLLVATMSGHTVRTVARGRTRESVLSGSAAPGDGVLREPEKG